jgi:uncharacterized protein YigA (DUF484 family)
MGNLKSFLILRERSLGINELTLSSSRYNDSAIASPSLELTKRWMSLRVIFDRKLYREVRRVKSSSRYNGSAVASPSLELTKRWMSLRVIFDRKLYREVRRGLSSSRYDFMGFLSNPMKSLELTKRCFDVTSSVLFVLQKQAKCTEK